MTMGMTAAWSPALRRLIRRLKRHLAGFCRFINVIFGAALFRRVEPSVETVDVGRQVFDLLEHRRGCRSSVGVHDGEDARAERPEHAAATLKRRTSAAVSGTSDDDVDEDLAALETMRQLVAMCRQLDLLTEIVNDDGYNALQVSVMYDDVDAARVLLDAGWLAAAYSGDMGVFPPASCHCSLPLHVACRRGNLDAVDLLLDAGADPTSRSSAPMCYPRPHRPIRHVPSRFHFIETDVYPCESASEPRGDALWHALVADRVDVVRRLLASRSLCGASGVATALRDSCRVGAIRCARYFLETVIDREPSKRRRVAMLNAVDADDGSTSLLHAARLGRRSLVAAIVERGGNIRAFDSRGRTALHYLLLFRARAVGPSPRPEVDADRLDCCNYILACGLESKTNNVDCVGNTALHLAVDLINRKSVDGGSASADDVDRHREEVIPLLGLISTLLNHNCDPDALNSSGVSALHRLLLTFDALSSDPSLRSAVAFDDDDDNDDDDDDAIRAARRQPQYYSANAQSVRMAVEALLAGGASPVLRIGGDDGPTPVELLLDCMTHLDPEVIRSSSCCVNELVECMAALCRAGASPSVDDRTHVAVVTLLVHFARRCMSLRHDRVVGSALASVVCDVLRTLIRGGLDLNRKSLPPPPRQTHVIGRRATLTSSLSSSSSKAAPGVNVLAELVQLVADVRWPSVDMEYLRRWLLTCLRNGADPDVEPYPPAVATDDVICHSQSCIFIRPASDVDIRSTCAVQRFIDLVADLFVRPRPLTADNGDDLAANDAAIERLLMLFYGSMSHDVLFRCLRTSAASLVLGSALNFVAAEGGNHSSMRPAGGGPRGCVARVVSKLAFRPRSLKRIARVTVHVALGRQLESGVHLLPLPASLKQYLLDIE